MPLHLRTKFILLLAGSLALVSSSNASVLSERELKNGLGFVTTVEGTPRISYSESTEQASLTLHQTLALSNGSLETGASDRLVVSLSNGTALALGPMTRVHVLSFAQEPFSADEESYEREPSVSIINLALEQGSLAIAADRLSPLSELSIQTELGLITSNTVVGHISHESGALELTACDGHMTLTRRDSGKREFIASPNGMKINTISQIQQRHTARVLKADATALVKAAETSRDRVVYRITDEESFAPSPSRVMSPDQKRPSPRPYRFLD